MHHEDTQPAITWLNMTGDITISWDDTNKDAVLALVEQKMKEGYAFFILKPRPLGLGMRKTLAKSIKAVAKTGNVVVPDDEFERMMARPKVDDPAIESALTKGSVRLVRGQKESEFDATKRARTAAEVVEQQTVAVRRVVGG